MDSWDVVLIVVVGYLAVTTLVRLMNRRRQQMLSQLRQEAEQLKKHKKPTPDPQQEPSGRKVA